MLGGLVVGGSGELGSESDTRGGNINFLERVIEGGTRAAMVGTEAADGRVLLYSCKRDIG